MGPVGALQGTHARAEPSKRDADMREATVAGRWVPWPQTVQHCRKTDPRTSAACNGALNCAWGRLFVSTNVGVLTPATNVKVVCHRRAHVGRDRCPGQPQPPGHRSRARGAQVGGPRGAAERTTNAPGTNRRTCTATGPTGRPGSGWPTPYITR